jgi:hypothetical protein
MTIAAVSADGNDCSGNSLPTRRETVIFCGKHASLQTRYIRVASAARAHCGGVRFRRRLAAVVRGHFVDVSRKGTRTTIQPVFRRPKAVIFPGR